MKEDGQITGFVEKPQTGLKPGALTNAAIYILERSIFSYIPDNGNSDFSFHIFPTLIRSGVRIYGYVLNNNEYAIDIGTWEHYQQACKDLKSGRVMIAHQESSVDS